MTTLAQLLAPFNDTTNVVVLTRSYIPLTRLAEAEYAIYWKQSNSLVHHCYFNGAGELVIILE